MKIDLFNLDRKFINFRYKKKLSVILNKGIFLFGKNKLSLEKNISSYFNSKYSVSYASGLDSLESALRLCDIKKGDKVMVPAFTFIAVWIAVSRIGAIPVPIDIDKSIQINLDKIKEINCKAIIYVLMYGSSPQHLDKLRLLKKETKIVFDGSQAHETFNLLNLNSYFDIAAFSFYPTKNISGINDSGCIIFNKKKYLQKAKAFSSYGSTLNKYQNRYFGINSRVSEINSLFINYTLENANKWLVRKTTIGDHLNDLFKSIGIETNYSKNSNHSLHLFTIYLTNNRNKIIKNLKKKKIKTDIHYPIPPFRQKIYSNYNKKKISYFRFNCQNDFVDTM